MRILWISPNGGKYNLGDVKGTGGWIGSLQEELMTRFPNLELGITFESTTSESEKKGNITYYPIKTNSNSKIKRLIDLVRTRECDREQILIDKILYVIDAFAPDVIHVWGIENSYAAVIPYLRRPFVVHIQGLLSISINTYMPPLFSENDLLKIDSWWKPRTWMSKLLHVSHYDNYKLAKYRAERELAVAKYVNNWIGRTTWDYCSSRMLSPKSQYFHCDEIIREHFKGVQWMYHYNEKEINIHSSLSDVWYKGLDVVLKTAYVLKMQGVCVKWSIYGVSNQSTLLHYLSKRFGIDPTDVGLHFYGQVSGDVICKSLLSSDVFVHPSYIENSSNAIAEAMMLGVPTIAQYVGGNPSMLRDDSGVLVAADSPYEMAYAILTMRKRDSAEYYSKNALAVSEKRQNVNRIVSELQNIYQQLMKMESCK